MMWMEWLKRCTRRVRVRYFTNRSDDVPEKGESSDDPPRVDIHHLLQELDGIRARALE